MKIYIVENVVDVAKVECLVDKWIPLQVKFNRFAGNLSWEAFYLSYFGEDGVFDMNIGAQYGELYQLSCTSMNSIKLLSGPAPSRAKIHINKAICLNINETVSNKYISFKACPSIDLYDDCIDINIYRKPDAPLFLFNEGNIGALTDCKFNLLGFRIYKSKYIREELINYHVK